MDGQLSVEDEVMKKYIGDFTFDDDEYSDWIDYISNIFFCIYDYNLWPCISSCGSLDSGHKAPKAEGLLQF